MESVFVAILNRSIAAGWLILAVLVARFILKKAPRWMIVLLWGMVALRLLVPFSVKTEFSLLPGEGLLSGQGIHAPAPEGDKGEAVSGFVTEMSLADADGENGNEGRKNGSDAGKEEDGTLAGRNSALGTGTLADAGIEFSKGMDDEERERAGIAGNEGIAKDVGSEESVSDAGNEGIGGIIGVEEIESSAGNKDAAGIESSAGNVDGTEKEDGTEIGGVTAGKGPEGMGEVAGNKGFFVASLLWLAGCVGMLFYAMLSTVKMALRLREAVPDGEGVWRCDQVDTPFIMGVLRPRIYLPSDLAGNEVKYVLAHERAHLRRGDHIWKLLGFLTLALHWFNPFVWEAWILFGRDLEKACDEKVLKEMGFQEKKAYANALLACSMQRSYVMAYPLAFGEVDVKARIKGILSYKKPTFWGILVAAVICLAVGLCFLTDPGLRFSLRADRVEKITIFSGTTGEEVEVTDREEIDKIVGYVNAMALERDKVSLGYMGYGYHLTFYGRWGKLKDFILNGEEYVRKDPYFYHIAGGSELFDYVSTNYPWRNRIEVLSENMAYEYDGRLLELSTDGMFYLQDLMSSNIDHFSGEYVLTASMLCLNCADGSGMVFQRDGENLIWQEDLSSIDKKGTREIRDRNAVWKPTEIFLHYPDPHPEKKAKAIEKASRAEEDGIRVQEDEAYYQCDAATVREIEAWLEAMFEKAGLENFDQGHTDGAVRYAAQLFGLEGEAEKTANDREYAIPADKVSERLEENFVLPKGYLGRVPEQKSTNVTEAYVLRQGEKLIFDLEDHEPPKFQIVWEEMVGEMFRVCGGVGKEGPDGSVIWERELQAILSKEGYNWKIYQFRLSSTIAKDGVPIKLVKYNENMWEKDAEEGSNAGAARETGEEEEVLQFVRGFLGNPALGNFDQENIFNAAWYAAQKMVRDNLELLKYHDSADYYTISFDEFEKYAEQFFVLPKNFKEQIREMNVSMNMTGANGLGLAGDLIVFRFFEGAWGDAVCFDSVEKAEGEWLVFGHSAFYPRIVARVTKDEEGNLRMQEFEKMGGYLLN